MDWREAFLRQARSDNSVRKLLNEQGAHYAHQLHYIQMASEKMARAYLMADPQVAPKFTHVAFVRFLRALRMRRDLARQLRYKNQSHLVSAIRGLLPLAQEVENLAPDLAGATNPNPEYPWMDAKGQVQVPVEFNFPACNPRRWEMSRLLDLLDRLLDIAS